MISRIAPVVALSLLLTGASALAEPLPTPPAAKPFKLGAFQLVALRDADYILPNDGKSFVGVSPAAIAAALKRAGAPTDKLTLGVNALLVKEPGRIVLLDTGLGPDGHGALLGSLAEAGVAPDQVTDILITHTHGDHVGGLATKDGLAFPNAVVHMSSKEWAWMQSLPPNKRLVDLIRPKVRTFEPGEIVAPGITAVAIYGHTPGHCGYEIESQGQRLLDIGDTAHSAIVSLSEPDWVIQFDDDAVMARASRKAMLARLAEGHERVFAPHFPFPGVGRIAAQDHGYTWKPGLP
jgi:glyoxylase-like metal-dependent hydrolase (beta-lactamase superfamily II)